MKRLLLIEDSVATLEMMTYFLEKAGLAVITATSAEKGLELARIDPPDLIVCDIGFPRMDGYTFATIAKADPVLMNIPLVAVTAHAMQEDQGRAKEAGFDGYLTKPIDAACFASQIEAFLV